MSAGTFSSFALQAQLAADAMLAHLQHEKPEAAERLAGLIATKKAWLTIGLTIRDGEAWCELLVRTADATASVASVPLKVGLPTRAN